MANDVRNEFSFMCEAPYISKIRLKISELQHQLTHSDLETVLWPGGLPASVEYDGRTRFTDEYGDDFGFRSAWGPCTFVQIRICQILAEIAPNVAVINLFSEEFGQAVGAGVSVCLAGEYITERSDEDLSSQIEGLKDRLRDIQDRGDLYNDDLEEESAIYEGIDELIDQVKRRHLERVMRKIDIGISVKMSYV